MSYENISVAEFLEFEFYFELAQHLKCNVNDLKKIKSHYPKEFTRASNYVLATVVTSQCKLHIKNTLHVLQHQTATYYEV